MQAVHIVLLSLVLAVVLYRAWRWWQHPTIPGAAVVMFGASLWLWALWDIPGVWSVLPEGLQIFQFAAGTIIAPAASLHVLVVSITNPPERNVHSRIGIIVASASTMIAVVLLISFTTALPDGSPYSIHAASDQISIVAATVITHAYTAAIFIHIISIGVRETDRSPVGTGIGLVAAASVFELFPVIHGGIWTPLALHLGREITPRDHMVFQIAPGIVATLLFLAALIWPPWQSRAIARRQLRILAPLRQALTAQFPDLGPPTPRGTQASDLVYEWTAQIQDGLSLTAQHRNIPLGTAQPPADDTEHAGAVINWLRDESAAAINEAWLNPPPTMTAAQWTLALAKAHIHATTAMH